VTAATTTTTLAAPRGAHSAMTGGAIRVQQLEVDLPLREIDAAQAHAHAVAQLPAPPGALSHQS
jgi:hypothetical protein